MVLIKDEQEEGLAIFSESKLTPRFILAKTTFIGQYLEFLPKTGTRKGVDSHVSGNDPTKTFTQLKGTRK